MSMVSMTEQREWGRGGVFTRQLARVMQQNLAAVQATCPL